VVVKSEVVVKEELVVKEAHARGGGDGLTV
jgi:hypothetical protein